MLRVNLCIHLRVIIVIGVTLAVIYRVITIEWASFTAQLLVTIFIASLLNY